MNLGELITQTHDLTNTLLSGSAVLDSNALREAAVAITSTIKSHLSDAQNQEEIASLEGLLQGPELNISDFYVLANSAIIRYAAAIANQTDSYKNLVIARDETIRGLYDHLGYINNIIASYHIRYPNESDRFTGRGVIYTAITGGYDSVIEPAVQENYDYILLTDHEPSGYNGEWKIRVVDNPNNLSPRMLARYLKMHPHEFLQDYDFSIYVDGCMKILGNFKEFISTYRRKSGMICFPHHESKDLLEEAACIIDNNKGSQDELVAQIHRYQLEGYTGKGFTIETGCLAREHHDESLKAVMNDWWDELCKYEHGRDQMSFDYACWKNNYEYDVCDLPVYKNPYCEAMQTH